MAGVLGSKHEVCEECKKIHDKVDRLSHLVQALACRTPLERQQIRETYRAMYGDNLVNRLQTGQVTGQKTELRAVLSMWMLDPHERDAFIARDALGHGDTNYKALLEIYSGRKSSQLLLIQEAYLAKFRRNLDQDIMRAEPSHPHQKILVALATSHKSHDTTLSLHVAKCDAKRLYEAGEGRTGGAMDEAVVLEIISKRSIPQLKLTFSSYKHIYGHDFTKSIKKETTGEFEDSLRVTAKCLHDPAKYYAKVLHMSIKGMTTDKSALERVIVSRAEMDMDEIWRVFETKYGMKLCDAICERIPNGEYRDFLVALATAPSPTD